VEGARCDPDRRPHRGDGARADPNDSSGDIHGVGNADAPGNGHGPGPHSFGVDHRPARTGAPRLGARTVQCHGSGRHGAGNSDDGARHRLAASRLGRRRLAVVTCPRRWPGRDDVPGAARSRGSDQTSRPDDTVHADDAGTIRSAEIHGGAPEPDTAGVLHRGRRDDVRHGDTPERGPLTDRRRELAPMVGAWNFLQIFRRDVYEKIFRSDSSPTINPRLLRHPLPGTSTAGF